eukprot:6185999-Pleurochrysis_carterae.AAC.1
MHPVYGRKFRPVPTYWTLRKEFTRLRKGETATLAVGTSTAGATLSFKHLLIASIRRARDDGSLVNTASPEELAASKFCVHALLAGDGFKAGSSKE